MTQNTGQPDEPQEWKTYPNGPEPASQSGPPARPEGYADPLPPDTPQSYPAYPAYPPDPGQEHNQAAPYQPARYQQTPQPPRSRLNQTWLWIVMGVVASFVILSVVRGGNAWSLFVFVGIAWWLWQRGRRR